MLKKLLVASALMLSIPVASNAQCVATISGNSTACYGTTTILQATGGGVSYQWYDWGIAIPGATSDQYTPNASGSFTVVVDFGGCTDSSLVFGFTQNSIFYMFFPNLDSMLCVGDMLQISAVPAGGTAPYTYSWVGPNSFVTSTQNVNIPSVQLGFSGTYVLTITDALGCTAVDNVNMTVLDCDSVWPGDVNWDLTADNNDVLDLALAYGNTGTARTGASNNWVAQFSATWNTMQTSGVNMKHADCNGDGTVDASDTTAISLNYGQVHMKGEHQTVAKSAADPDLYFDLTGINFIAGTTVSIPIKLGTNAIPMNNILGIAANIHVDGITLNNSPAVNASTSWMGTTADLLNFTKGVNSNQTGWTLARVDQANVSGDGTIATLTMDIPAGTAGQDAILYFSDVKIIDNSGTVITNYNVIDDTAAITLNVPSTASNVQYAVIAPNPAQGKTNLQLSLAEPALVYVDIHDLTGRKVAGFRYNAAKGFQNIALPVADLPAGIYNVRLTDSEGTLNKNLQLVRK